MSRMIGAYEAKTRLPELLRDVENGDHVTITVRGRPVAELAPIRPVGGSIRDAVAGMEQFERITGVHEDTISAWVREGRR